MKKILVRVLAMTLVLMTMFTLCSAAFAATYSGSSAPNFGKSVSFYVKTNGETKHTVKAEFGSGKVFVSSRTICWGCDDRSCRGSYEAIVYFKNSAGNWQWEAQYTCYNAKSKELTLKKADTNYKIVIRAKTASVMWQSYQKNDVISLCDDCVAALEKGNYLCWNGTPPTVKLNAVTGVGKVTTSP